MVQEAIKTRTGKVRKHKTYGKDREQMTEEALSAIRKTGTAAALEKCRMVADLINAQIEGADSEHFVDTSSVADLQAFLERAAAVLKKM
jgi:hypothetical protein